jgi:hypothetical protein
MKRPRLVTAALLAGGLVLGLHALRPARGQQILQQGFEGRDPLWVQGPADAAFKELAHTLTDETAHGGLRSEHIRVRAEKGSYVFYTYDVGRAPLTEDLNVSVWLKSNRPGVQLFCRAVLPRERDPADVAQPLTVLLRCEPYQSTRWKLVTLRQPVKRLQEQQQLLRHQLGRDVVVADAYIDRLILNVYDGPGLADVWVDDLEVGPVLDPRPPAAAPPRPGVAPARPASRRPAEVHLVGNKLSVRGERFFIRGIRHTGTPLSVLRQAGFNTVWLDESAPPRVIEDATRLGFLLVPTLSLPGADSAPGGVDARLTSAAAEELGRKAARFLDPDAVLCWDIGSNLPAERFPEVRRLARAFHTADPTRPLSADVWDGFQSYSRNVDQLLLGVHRWPLMTSLELSAYRDWLTRCRRLAVPDTFCWTWVQTHLPDWFLELAYDGGRKGFPEPLGPQAEQIRLLAYTAVGCGYRGLGFWSDSFLADSHTGRDRLLALALLNQELQMLEPLLVKAKEPEWVPTSHPEVMAAVLRTEGAVLVLPVWAGSGSQYVPGQGALMELTVNVPAVPDTAVAWEVSPARVQSLKTQRVTGFTQVKIHNFSLTAAVVFTSDLGPSGLVVDLQNKQRQMAKVAAQWAHDQAAEELAKVEKVQDALEKGGHTLPDAGALLSKARDGLAQCLAHRRAGAHAEAYADAQVTLRALRVLMRAHWDKAVRDLDTPVASPYAVSFFTLPRHWRLVDEVKRARPAGNVLPDGDFEAPPQRVPRGWLVQEVPSLDPVRTAALRVNEQARSGRQCLKIEVTPKDKEVPPPQALERTFVAVHSPGVRLPPGTLVRVSAWVKVPKSITGSVDGALLYDSAGGEPLGVRLTGPTPNGGWKRYALYRRVPASGTLYVTMALSGLGAVYFDDVRVEPLVAAAPLPAPPAPSGARAAR